MMYGSSAGGGPSPSSCAGVFLGGDALPTPLRVLRRRTEDECEDCSSTGMPATTVVFCSAASATPNDKGLLEGGCLIRIHLLVQYTMAAMGGGSNGSHAATSRGVGTCLPWDSIGGVDDVYACVYREVYVCMCTYMCVHP